MILRTLLKPVVITVLLFTASTVNSQALEFESTDRQTTLVELFTSEGCSSCPPAERAINQLRNHPDLWNTFVPVAFHVDYWDYLGWDDPYASKAYSDRQRQYRRQGLISAVYTPGMLQNGREWRSWYRDPKPAGNSTNAGKLKVLIDDNRLTASYERFENDMVLNIVPLGFDIKTQVRAGENKGRTLKHDFVALDHHILNADQGRWIFELTSLGEQRVQMQAIAVWISREDSLTPIQATGGWVCPRDLK